MQQSKIDFRSIKNLKRRRTVAVRDGSTLPDVVRKDKSLMRLRMPDAITRALPSVKRFHTVINSKTSPTENDECVVVEEDEDIKPEINNPVLGLRRRRGEQNKYRIKQSYEKNFGSMIWDLAFVPGTTDIVVATFHGVFLCDTITLAEKQKLEKVVQGGGIGFLSSGEIVVLCRSTDMVHVYHQDGTWVRSFYAGNCPMCVTVNTRDNIIVTDTGTKSLRKYTSMGKLIREIPSQGEDYQLKWPLYVDTLERNQILVTDCHMEGMYVFDFKGRFLRCFPLKTFGGNEVLRPHGLHVNKDRDLFVIDNAIDSVEVFQQDGMYLQTLIHPEEGESLKPKAIASSGDGKHLAIGGMYGKVRLFKFLQKDEIPSPREDRDVIVIE